MGGGLVVSRLGLLVEWGGGCLRGGLVGVLFCLGGRSMVNC